MCKTVTLALVVEISRCVAEGVHLYPLGCGHAVRRGRSTLQKIRSQIEPENCPMGLGSNKHGINTKDPP